jgi:hypothetical protein
VKRGREDTLEIEDLLEFLSEGRVYLREKYNYCIKCKIPNIDKVPCKHDIDN